MFLRLNPPHVFPPASQYAHAVLHKFGGARRLVISGQVGLRLDGTVPSDFVSQMDLAWDNLLEIVEAADMNVENLLKISMFAVPPNSITMVRAMRDKKLKGHICASTYLQVAGLANPAFLFEVEAEAIGPNND
ncbi:MAG: Rid family hydrolase [Beijerinckiaceae bacterium]